MMDRATNALFVISSDQSDKRLIILKIISVKEQVNPNTVFSPAARVAGIACFALCGRLGVG